MRSLGTLRFRPASAAWNLAFGVATLIVTAVSGQDDRGVPDALRSGPGVFNHPVNVRPSERIHIPKGWPLATDGSITCLTCHSSIPVLDDGNPKLRASEQVADGQPFCAACHTDQDRSSAAAAHWLAVDVAHVRPGKNPSSRGGGGRIDDDSARCLSCHDGVNASEAQNMTAWNRSAAFNGPISGNHPIGVQYPSRPSRGVESGFRPAGLLPREVQLPNGVVSCVSCHNLYGREQHRLTVPLEGSELCFTCHDMK